MSAFRDLKIAIRHLLKSPGFSLTAVLMAALGIGATTAIFSIVEGVLLRSLPFPDPDRIMMVADILRGADVGGNGEAGVTVPDIRNYTRDTHSFTSLGGFQPSGYELSGIGDPAQEAEASLARGGGCVGLCCPRLDCRHRSVGCCAKLEATRCHAPPSWR